MAKPAPQPDPHANGISKWQQHLTLQLPATQPGCIWLHACSVGEVASVVPLFRALTGQGHKVHLTVVTATGFAHAKRVLGKELSVSYLPWDIPGCMARLVNRLKPALLLLAETEFWPGMLMACKKNRIPVVGINTRISDRSFPRYQATSFYWRRCLDPVVMFLAQSQLDAERLIAMGVAAGHVKVVGNLKYAISAPSVEAQSLRLKLDSSGSRPILLVASTHEGEDRAILNMWPAWRAACHNLLTVIVPRHPERFDQVAELIREHGHRLSRWSEQQQHDSDFILVDAMGVLGDLYSVADVVIIAGSLKNIGGHNPLEAAVCGRGVVTGPFVQNFREIMHDMQRQNAVIIASNAQELEAAVTRLLQHPDELKQLHAHATLFMQDKTGVLESTLECISPYLPPLTDK